MSSTMAWMIYIGGYVAGGVWTTSVCWYHWRKYRTRYFPFNSYRYKRALIISAIGFCIITFISTVIASPYIS